MQNSPTPKVSVVIPTINAEQYLEDILCVLESQTYKPLEILVVDSGSIDASQKISESHDLVEFISMGKDCFDHAKTRHGAILRAKGDFVFFLTQDAVPSNMSYIADMLAAFKDSEVALCYARQIPRSDHPKYVKLVWDFNYPNTSCTKSMDDLETLGIKTFFCSNAASAYRKSAYLECGGFKFPSDTNEDMLMAATLIHKGHKVAYVANATVTHSHNFSFKQQYKRNFLIGKFLSENSKLLESTSATAEGKKLFKSIAGKLLKQGNLAQLFLFTKDCTARYFGQKAGKSALQKA